MIKNPYYIAEITSSRCSVEFSLNGIPNYNHFEETNEASTATIEWPINLFILQNGQQDFELKILPLKKSATILEKALVRIKIFKAEAIEEYVQQELVSEEIEVTFADEKGIYYIPEVGFSGLIYEFKVELMVGAFKRTIEYGNKDEPFLKPEPWTGDKQYLPFNNK